MARGGGRVAGRATASRAPLAGRKAGRQLEQLPGTFDVAIVTAIDNTEPYFCADLRRDEKPRHQFQPQLQPQLQLPTGVNIAAAGRLQTLVLVSPGKFVWF